MSDYTTLKEALGDKPGAEAGQWAPDRGWHMRCRRIPPGNPQYGKYRLAIMSYISGPHGGEVYADFDDLDTVEKNARRYVGYDPGRWEH